MKPTKCNEIDSSITQLGEHEFAPDTTDKILSHLDQCTLCEQQYGHFRQVLSGIEMTAMKLPDSRHWQTLPDKVLAQVNEFKALIPGANQNLGKTSTPQMSTNEDEQTAEFNIDASGKVSLISSRQGKVHKSVFSSKRVWYQIAASVLLVVTVVMLLGKPTSDYQYNPVEFQLKLSQTHDLSQLLRQWRTADGHAEIYSFIGQQNNPSGFVVGSYFAEALALVDDSDRYASVEHLRDLQQRMTKNGGPDEPSRLLDKTIHVLSASLVSRTDRIDSIATFADEYIEYLKLRNVNEVIYFRLGAWTVNMALAASSKDLMIKQEKLQIDYFVSGLSALSAPQGVIRSLQAMRGIIDRPASSELDYRQFLQFSAKLRRLLA
ncbi:MAG: hypothetical protein ACC707_07390 [Thiohalomonadales bacterium]